MAKNCNFIEKLRTGGSLNRESFDNYIDNTKELNEVNCLIVGCGDIGSRIGKMCYSLGMKISVIKNDNSKNYYNFVNNYFSLNDLDIAVDNMDFVINLLPLTDKTKNIFNKKVFYCMNNNSYFINLGRGKTVNENDLIEVLKDKVIMGAALDVFDVEPLSDKSPLWDIEDVFITPHIANVSKNYWKNQIELFTKNINRFRNNNNLINIINLNRGY